MSSAWTWQVSSKTVRKLWSQEQFCKLQSWSDFSGRWGKYHSLHDRVKKCNSLVKGSSQAPSSCLTACLTPYTSPQTGFLGLCGYPLPGILKNTSWCEKKLHLLVLPWSYSFLILTDSWLGISNKSYYHVGHTSSTRKLYAKSSGGFNSAE